MLNSNKDHYYIGLDIHKRNITYCVKKIDGEIVRSGQIAATRASLESWRRSLGFEWSGAMEATLFTSWIYDALKPYTKELKVGNPLMMKAISASKRKNDRLDAKKIADALRADLIPECYMAPAEIRDLRRCLRQRNFLVREITRLKNNTSGMLMMSGAQYSKSKLHYKKYFQELMIELKNLSEIPPSIIEMSKSNRAIMEVCKSIQRNIIKKLKEHPLIRRRIELLQTVPGVGEITALSWALEIGEPHRFRNAKKAISYCGFCSGQSESGGKTFREPISKQRNKNIQWVLIEAAHLASRRNSCYAEVYAKAKEKSSHNEAIVAVARKMVGYLLAVDKSGKQFEMREKTSAEEESNKRNGQKEMGTSRPQTPAPQSALSPNRSDVAEYMI